MEVVFLYLAKVSALITLFYLAYYFLVRKETFFEANRWFLLSGLATALVLPFCFIKRIVVIEQPQISLEEIKSVATIMDPNHIGTPVEPSTDWLLVLGLIYGFVVLLFLVKIIMDLASLHKMINNQHHTKNERLKLVNIKQNITPFSFFNLIVYNDELYTPEELNSIILHEKVHCSEHHSMDVLLMQIFCAIFWFNPFIWFYKKAVTQNLEYIADQKAIQQLDNRYVYQHALLKVVSHQNCLSITTHFYQSLIKKRIVMLNTNQSNKRKSWKYTLILPLLLAYVFLFQIKTIAQEKGASLSQQVNQELIRDSRDIAFDATESNQSLKSLKNIFKEEKIVTDISNIKRNSTGEIIGIHIKMKCEDGRKKELKINQTSPIDKIYLYTNRLENGLVDFGIKHVSEKEISAFKNKIIQNRKVIKILNEDEDSDAISRNDSIDVAFEINLNDDNQATSEKGSRFRRMPKISNTIPWGNSVTQVIVKKGDANKVVFIDGEVVEGDESLLTKEDLELIKKTSKANQDNDNLELYVDWDDAVKISNEEKDKANSAGKSTQSIVKKKIRVANGDWKKVREELVKVLPEIDKANAEMDASKPEMDKAKAEMIKAKEEMIRAKEELLKAKAELDKERANLKKRRTK